MRSSVLLSALAILSTAVAQFDSEQCGPQAGNQKCAGTKCCSQYGWCGTGDSYCAKNCQPTFGTCKGNPPAPVVSKNGRCGSDFGDQTCQGSSYGDCCSQYSYCGGSSAHCSTGCQSNFGSCLSVAAKSSTVRASSTISSSKTVSTSSPSPSPISNNGRCGSKFGGRTCKGSQFGECCSSNNWCGSTNDHCKASSGCQSAFGTCSGVSSVSSSIRLSTSSSSISHSGSASYLASSSVSPHNTASTSGSAIGSSSSHVSPPALTSSHSTISPATSSVHSTPTSPSESSGTPIYAASSSTQLLSQGSASGPQPASHSSSAVGAATSSAASSSPSSSHSSTVTVLSSDSSSPLSSQSQRVFASESSSVFVSPVVSSSPAPGESNVASAQSTPVVSSTVLSADAPPKVIPASSFSSSSSLASPSPMLPAFAQDPLTAPGAAMISKNGNIVVAPVTDRALAPPGSSTGSYLSIVADTNGAALTISTQPAVKENTRYIVSVWLKSNSAEGHCSVDVFMGVNKIGASGDNIPTDWKQYFASYSASSDISLALRLVVTCPRTGDSQRLRFKRQTDTGLSMGGLAMDPDTSVISSSIPMSFGTTSMVASAISVETPAVDSTSTPLISAILSSPSAMAISTSPSLSVASSSSYAGSSSLISSVPALNLGSDASVSSSIASSASSSYASSSSVDMHASTNLVTDSMSMSATFSESSAMATSVAVPQELSYTASSSIASSVPTTTSSSTQESSSVPSSVVTSTSTNESSTLASMSPPSPPITTAPPSSTEPIPTGCTPTIIDGGFASFTVDPVAAPSLGLSTSDDWTVSRAYYEKAGEFFANVGVGPEYTTNAEVLACSSRTSCLAASYKTFNMFTNNTGAISYDLKYKHKLSLCAGVAYDVSGWVRTQQASRQAYNPEGCRVIALLSDQQAFTDRIGYWDWPQYRYLHGVVTPSRDMIAELVFRVDCSVPQYSLPRARGIKLDAVAVVPVSQWSLPAEAIPSRTTTAYTMDDYGNEVPPITLSPTHTPCAAQAVALAKTGCVLYDEQMENGGFELCANMYYALIDPVNGYQWTQETSPVNWTVVAPYGLQSDEVHSGQNALRVVFKDDVKDVGVRLMSQTYIRTCVERSYVWSFWAKQGKNSVCTVAFNFAGVNQGTFTPGNDWTKHEGRMDIPQGGATNSDNSLDWLINCATGGMDSRVLIDDISFNQINGDISS